MGLEFLARVRRTAFGAALFVALYATVYSSLKAGRGLAAGALWSLMQMWLLEKVVVGMTSPVADEKSRMKRLWLPLAAHVAMLGVGAVLLLNLPAMWLAAGFTLPFAVILLKAVSRQLVESDAWKGFVASRWKPAVALAIVLGGLWFLATWTNRANAESTTPAPATTEHVEAGATHEAPAATEHATTEAGAAEHGGGEHAEHGKKKGSSEFPDLVTLALELNHSNPFVHQLLAVPDAEKMTPEKREEAEEKQLQAVSAVGFSLIVAIVLCVIAFLASRKPQMVPGPLQNVVEALVDAISTQICDILGPKYGPRYVPFLGSLFIYIFAMNLFGIVPLMKSPTSNLNVTLALALTVFVYVQYSAIKESGPLGYLDHLAGSPRTAIDWALVPLLFPIHVIGEIAKPVSLSCRLFGNIFGEDMLLVGFATLGIGAFAAMGLGGLPFGLPVHFVFLFLALLTSFVQAMVFSMLSTIYFLLMLPHDHGHDHDHGHGGEAHHNAH
jgi:F-type H+-transporting ATPase subunit a